MKDLEPEQPQLGTEKSRQDMTPAAGNSRLMGLQEQERMQKLAEELRCLVCQNQTIADSNSGLAVDLRGQIAEQIRAGKTDVAIKQYMVERYGEFVLYNPPFNTNNAALWLGPFLLLVIGVWLAVRVIRKNARSTTTQSGEVLNQPTIDTARAQAIEERYRQQAANKN